MSHTSNKINETLNIGGETKSLVAEIVVQQLNTDRRKRTERFKLSAT